MAPRCGAVPCVAGRSFRMGRRDAQLAGLRVARPGPVGGRGVDRGGAGWREEGAVQARANRGRRGCPGPLASGSGPRPRRVVLGSGELADTTVLRAASGGQHERLFELHVEHARQATREGFTGLALTGDAAAMRTVTRDATELAGYERALDRLADQFAVPSLCRYPAEEQPELLGDMLEVHFRDVDDEDWAAVVVADQLRVRGEIDFSNADRFAAVLRAVIADGLHRVDLSGVEFCAVAGIRALLSATDRPHPGAAHLTLQGVAPLLVRLLTITGAADRPGLQLIRAGNRGMSTDTADRPVEGRCCTPRRCTTPRRAAGTGHAVPARRPGPRRSGPGDRAGGRREVLRSALGGDGDRVRWQEPGLSDQRLGEVFETFRGFFADRHAAGQPARLLTQNDLDGDPDRLAAYLRLEAVSTAGFPSPRLCLGLSVRPAATPAGHAGLRRRGPSAADRATMASPFPAPATSTRPPTS